MDQSIALPETSVALASATVPMVINSIGISAPIPATASAGNTNVVQTITIGLPNLGVNQYDKVNRAEPFDPYLTTGDLVNRAEPLEYLTTPSGVAVAVAVVPTTVLTNHITIFIGTAPATATAVPLELELAAPPVIEEFRRNVVGQSGAKRAQREKENETIVGAKLVSVNGKRPEQSIQGFVRILGESENVHAVRLVEGIKTRIRSPWEDIKIKITRVA